MGRGICQPAKNGTVAQNSTNRHKPAQTGTNQHTSAQFMCRGRGEAHPLFIVCYSSRLHRLTFTEWQYRHPAGNTRSGGHLLTGRCQGLFPCCWRHNCRCHHCNTILLLLLQLLSAASSPHLTAILSYCWFICAVDTTLSVSYSSSSLLRPHVVAIAAVAFGRCPTPSCRHCYCQVDCWTDRAADVASSASYSSLSSLWPHFGAHSPSLPLPIVVFGSPSSSAPPPPPGTWARGRWPCRDGQRRWPLTAVAFFMHDATI